jgi:uncharacterized protein YggE
MNNLQKTIMVWVVVGLIVITGVFMVISVRQKLNTATTTNTVSFTGQGKILAKPDVAVLNFSVLTEAATSKAAQDANSEKSKTVANFLKKQNIEDKDIKTISYNIYPQYNYPRNGIPQIKGYQVNQAYDVKIRDLDKVSSMLDGIVGAGANQVSNLRFEIDNPEKLKDQARAKAIDDAKDKAGALKGQLGIDLGKIINFSENVAGYPTPIMYNSMAAKEGLGMGGGGPDIQTGENEITVNITITYQIK